jgi:SAM-dependent methyltransferase
LLFVNNPPSDNDVDDSHRQGLHRGNQTLDVTGNYNPSKINFYSTVIDDLGICVRDKTEWLDIGCGHGEFIESLLTRFGSKLKTTGSEPNVNKINSGKSRGLDISFINMSTHLKQYDYISLLNVYSHLPDPYFFIKDIKKNLKDFGELIIQTGDSSQLPATFQCYPLSLPDHLSFTSSNLLISFLEENGFEVLAVKKYAPFKITLKFIINQLIKILIPGYKSNFNYIIGVLLYGDKRDMFIRARIKKNDQ